jgi:hypothetical protein
MEGLYKIDRAKNGSICCNGKLGVRADWKDGRAGRAAWSRVISFDCFYFSTPGSVKRHQHEKA